MDQYEYSIFPEKEITYASFGSRFGAAFIDGLILAVPVFLIKYLIDGTLTGYGLGSLAQILVQWPYFALQESGVNQATIGKKAMGIKVADEEGNRLSFAQASGRHFGKIISALIIYIGYLMMLWTDKKQTLHDKMAGAIVILS